MKEQDRELTSWKEIAAYLGVSLRSAQAWERTRGLPVHRFQGPRGPVYAVPTELDAWKRATIVQTPAREQSSRTFSFRQWTLAAATLAVAVLLVSFWPRPGIPAHYHVEQNTFIVTDERHRELWRKEFPSLGPPQYPEQDQAWIGDLDGNGTTTVIIDVVAGRAGFPEMLIAYNSRGEERWRYVTKRNLRSKSEAFPDRYRVRHFLVAPLGREHKTRIAVTSTHELSYPCQIALLDNNGGLLREYWHSGHLDHLAAADLQHEGWNRLLVAGINNGYKTSTLLVLDPDRFIGGKPRTAGVPDPRPTSAGRGRASPLPAQLHQRET